MLAILLDSVEVIAFDPVSVAGNDPSVQLSVLGTHRGGIFSRNSPTFPVYDPVTQRLFTGSVDRLRLDALDISDPSNPTPVLTDKFGLAGELGPNRIAMYDGVIAVSTENSSVAFFNALGTQLGSPVSVPGARELAFSPDGQKLVVTVSGEEVIPGTIQDSSVSIFDFSGEDWNACQTLGGCDLGLNPTISTASFTGLNSQRQQLLDNGVRLPFTSFPYSRTVAQDLEPGPVTVKGNSAWISFVDNNAIMEVDLNTSQVVNIFGLGAKDNSLTDNGFQDTTNSLPVGLPGGGVRSNGFDASDRDGAINIQTWPMKTFYEPDSIDTFMAGGQTFLVTANEGDPRKSFTGVETSERLKDISGLLGPNPIDPLNPVFSLQGDSQLGRLKVSAVDGDTDNDGDIDELYSFGTRSFSIWSDSGDLVFDSGDDFEQITAHVLPEFFNAPEDENSFDNRSDDRGPEPEVLDVGMIGEKSYVFVGFERIGGIMVYDVTDPSEVRFEQYINNRNFDIDIRSVCGVGGEKGTPEGPSCSQVGDLEPEGLLFISADDSPNGIPLLAVSHELSDSITLYQIDSLGEIPEPSSIILCVVGLLLFVSGRSKYV